jgi:hypothetical protein
VAFGGINNNCGNESATVGEIMDYECKSAFQFFGQLISARFLSYSHWVSHAVGYDFTFILHKISMVASEEGGT